MPKHKTRKNISLNNLGSKSSLLMGFGQFRSYRKRKKYIKKLYKNCCLVLGPSVLAKKEAQLLLENEIFEASYLYM